MGFFSDLKRDFKKGSSTTKQATGNGAKRVSPSSTARAKPNQFEFKAAYFQREAGTPNVNVVGESYYQSNISKICGRKADEEVAHQCVGTLIPEDDNPKDKNAVAVYLDGNQVGYLSKDEALRYRPALAAAAAKGYLVAGDARIYAYPPERARTPNAGVSLYLPPPEEVIEGLPS